MSEERTILLVDDAEMFRKLGSVFLAHSGRVLTASSGEEGIEIARRERPDVMLVDLMMPDLDGEQVCRIVKADPQLCQMPVIMLVGANTAGDWGRAVRAGADDVVAKPISHVSLNASVNRFLTGQPQRGLPRIPLDTAVQLQLETRTHEARLKNLSRGGLFVETECELADEREIGLRFELPESKTQFESTARVVWKQKKTALWSKRGVGMRFVDISSDLVKKLDDYVLDRAVAAHASRVGAI